MARGVWRAYVQGKVVRQLGGGRGRGREANTGSKGRVKIRIIGPGDRRCCVGRNGGVCRRVVDESNLIFGQSTGSESGGSAKQLAIVAVGPADEDEAQDDECA